MRERANGIKERQETGASECVRRWDDVGHRDGLRVG